MMRQFFYLLLIALFLVAFYGCSLAGSGQEEMAREVCACFRPLSESYNSMKKALAAKDSSTLQRLTEEMEAVNDQVSDCASRVEERYGALEGAREEQVKVAMQKICPEVIATLNEAERELVQ